MDSGSLTQHVLITLFVVVFHVLLFWIGGSSASENPQAANAERRLWRRFVGLLFVALVVFANVTLVIPHGSERAAALVAIPVLAMIYIDWRHGIRSLNRNDSDSDD
jgi:hypothetical protein